MAVGCNDRSFEYRPILVHAFLVDPGKQLERISRLPEPERQAAVEVVIRAAPRSPVTEVVDDAGFAHVIYRGAVQEVALTGRWPGVSEERLLHRLTGTDLFLHSLTLDPAGIWFYQLNVDLGEPGPDPGNPRKATLRGREWSVLALPRAPSAQHLEPLSEDPPRGQLETFTLASEHRGYFARIAGQSPIIRGLEGLAEIGDADGLALFLEARSDDLEVDGEDAAMTARDLGARLRAAGATVEVAEVAGGAGPLGWRTTLDRLLIWLFGRDR